MKQLSIMIKPDSSLCNLRCRYCFYADVADLRDVKSYGIMSIAHQEQMLRKLETQLAAGDKINFAFQGGEPTMAGLSWFQHFTEITGQWNPAITVTYALQTNGTLLNEEWCQYLADHSYLVGLSLDLLPQCHDDARVDTAGKGTWQRLMHTIELLNRFHVEYNVLCTLTRQIARQPQKVWKSIKALDIRYTQFTPCLDALDTPGKHMR